MFDRRIDHYDHKSKSNCHKWLPEKFPGILNWSWCPNHHITIIIISAINKGSILIIMGHHQLSIEISIQNIRIIIIIRAISIASMIDESWDTTNYQFRYRQKLLQGLDRSYCPSWSAARGAPLKIIEVLMLKRNSARIARRQNIELKMSALTKTLSKTNVEWGWGLWCGR